MTFIHFIFTLADRIVETIGGFFAWLVKLLCDLIGYGFSTLLGNTSTSSSLYGALVFLAFIVFIFLGVAMIYFAPWIVAILFIVLPLALLILKFTLGWLMLAGIGYSIYRLVRKLFKAVFAPQKIKESNEIF